VELFQFIETFQDAITRAVLRTYPPLYTARNRNDWGFDLRTLRRRPLGAQGDAIRAVALSLQRHRGTNLVGEMGTGKTTIAAAAAHLAGSRRVLVLCPPHLVRKWQREVLATVPGAGATIVRTLTDLERLSLMGGRPLFVILSRERAKLSYRWSPAVEERRAIDDGGHLLRNEDGEPLRRLCCPACFAPIMDDEGLPLEREELARKKRCCQECAGPLWQADRSGPPLGGVQAQPLVPVATAPTLPAPLVAVGRQELSLFGLQQLLDHPSCPQRDQKAPQLTRPKVHSTPQSANGGGQLLGNAL
jgi:hypothetical protein